MVDYSKAKIYQILNNVSDDVYIGATCQPLSVRMAGHRVFRTYEKARNYKLYRKMNEIGVEHFYIELLKETPCENTVESNRRRLYKKIRYTKYADRRKNKTTYTADNKDKKIEYDKKRREEKGDEINEKRRGKYNTDEEYRNRVSERSKEKYEQVKGKTEICSVCGV